MNSKTYHIKLNGKVYELEIEEVAAGAKAPSLAATPVKKEEVKEENVSETVVTAGGQDVEAPMPGTIFDIAVNVGDIVKNGQTLVVLEAMKMENEIVAPVDGKITAINVSKGQNVNLGDSIIQIG
ncbi:biotin/lipoyl-binding protein [Clostridium sp. D2Q-11]|uniref:Biotin/lipoyl-binding protein n=1 Tax=Anaeromonas frigoriresistens TaxID=2683708 RepID=A0A942V1S1_9FIRM|nr:biotin/lipoyl-containing protein [Anaeromonas frigoriresistens]MBS4538412.1 biotin/lipoyl-binding protein [Anaeromonas frigoriresistens]